MCVCVVFQICSSYILASFSQTSLTDGSASLAVDNNPGVATCSVTNGKKGYQSFYRATDNPVLGFWCHLPWVQSQSRVPCLCASLPVCNGFLRFTSGTTSANLLVSSITAELFQSTYVQSLVGHWGPGTSVPLFHNMKQMLYRLSYADLIS